MPAPSPELHDAADIIVWFSDHFIAHRKEKHPASPYGSRGEPETA
jgi:hypothetical protein